MVSFIEALWADNNELLWADNAITSILTYLRDFVGTFRYGTLKEFNVKHELALDIAGEEYRNIDFFPDTRYTKDDEIFLGNSIFLSNMSPYTRLLEFAESVYADGKP